MRGGSSCPLHTLRSAVLWATPFMVSPNYILSTLHFIDQVKLKKGLDMVTLTTSASKRPHLIMVSNVCGVRRTRWALKRTSREAGSTCDILQIGELLVCSLENFLVLERCTHCIALQCIMNCMRWIWRRAAKKSARATHLQWREF